jgi:hypothetical protein
MAFRKYLLLFVFVALAGCSSRQFLFDGRKTQEVTIADMGDLYSNYSFKQSDKVELSSQFNNKELVNQVVTYSQEQNWPDAVNTLEKRLNARTTMLRYRFFKVGVVGNKTIVAVPAAKNRHMPYGFVPAGAMYMIFKTDAVKGK